MIKSWILVALFIACNWSVAQSYVNYSEKDGLPSNHVYKITQDINGFIWIATDEGLVKHNGTDFKIFTTKDGLPTNDIFYIYPATDGKLWYMAKSTSLGYILDDRVYDFKNKDEELSFNPIFPSFTGNEVIASSSIDSHILNKDDKWEVMNYFQKENYLHQGYLINDRYKGIVLSKNGDKELFIVTQQDEYIKIQNSEFLYQSYQRLQLTDSLFISNKEYSYGFVNLKNLETKMYSYKDELGIDTLKLCRIHLANNRLQLSGENVVALLDKDLKAEKVIHIPKEWKSHFSFIDNENTIWAASFINGIYKYSIHEDVIKKEFQDFKINDIKRVNDKIIALINGRGFYEYDVYLQSFTPYLETSAFLFDAQYLEETNASYFFTRENIHVTSNSSIISQVPRKNDVLGEIARSIVYHDGSIYGHHTNGLNRIDIDDLRQLKYYNLNSARCAVSFQDKLIVGVSNGLYQLENDAFKMLPSLCNFKKPVIDLLTINKTTLLVSTSGFGVYTTDLNTIELLEGSEYLKANNPFYEDNHLYLPTNKGIYHYEWTENKFSLKNIWNNTNGLPTNKINGVEKVDDKLLVATNQGIIHFPLDYEPEQSLLGLYIEAASYEQHDLKLAHNVDYSENSDLQVVIKSIDYRNNQQLTYEFRLLPSQKDWVSSSSSNLIFSDLNPGIYKLELRSGYMNKNFDFYVAPRWYQTWWFYAGVFIGIIGIVIFMTKKVIKRQDKEKNRDLLQSQKLSELQLKALRSQMNPHFVFNSLTAIQYYINENDFETSDTYLVKFSRLVREFFELSKEQHITVEREVNLLKDYLDLEKLRFKSKLTYEIMVDPEIDLKSEIPSMLLQPIVENAVNHGIFNKSIPGKVTVKFTNQDNNQILIHIIDDGVGFTLNKENHRYKSSTVLEDRLKYLKDSGVWEITVNQSKAYNNIIYPGHKVTFNLKNMNNENL